MTMQHYVNYEIILMQQQFLPTGRVITQPPNWQRRTFSDQTISRVWLSHDGTFKAYNNKDLVICFGQTAEELQSCFD